MTTSHHPINVAVLDDYQRGDPPWKANLDYSQLTRCKYTSNVQSNAMHRMPNGRNKRASHCSFKRFQRNFIAWIRHLKQA